MAISIKTVGGKRYVYFEHTVDGKKVQKYCGPEGSVRARIKGLKFELEHIENRIGTDQRRAKEIRRELDRLEKGG